MVEKHHSYQGEESTKRTQWTKLLDMSTFFRICHEKKNLLQNFILQKKF